MLVILRTKRSVDECWILPLLAQPIRGHAKKLAHLSAASNLPMIWHENELGKLWQPGHANLLVQNQTGAHALVNDQNFGSAALSSHPNTPSNVNA